jgi:hypothetical protein
MSFLVVVVFVSEEFNLYFTSAQTGFDNVRLQQDGCPAHGMPFQRKNALTVHFQIACWMYLEPSCGQLDLQI